MDLIIAGQRHPLPWTDVVTWLDDPKRAPPVTDGAPRKVERVRGIVLRHARRRSRATRRRPRARSRGT